MLRFERQSGRSVSRIAGIVVVVVASFTVVAGARLRPPSRPGAPTPATGALSVACCSTALSWSASGATSYALSFGTTNPPPPVATGLTTASWVAPIKASTTYYWQVVARNAVGSTSGPVWNFSTAMSAPAPAAPTSPNPTDGAGSVAPNPTLGWSGPSGVSYTVAFGTTNPPPIVAQGLTAMSYPTVTTAGATYFWQVTATTSTGVSTTGPIWRFAETGTQASAFDPLVFVSRQILPNGSIYWNVPNDMPGVGPHSRFRVAAPGKLLVRDSDGSLHVLVDGAQPTAASLQLIDVNAPDVSYDGTEIVFAGVPAGAYDQGPVTNPGAWRLYRIHADGSGLRPVTTSDQTLDLSQFGEAAAGLRAYDDTDPAWLPDGRIVFSSTRWPSYAEYSGVRTTNLYVVNGDGTNLHRITAERNGADRPQVDPISGKVVYARWWRNQRFAVDDLNTIMDASGGYAQKDGLTINRYAELDGTSQYADYLWRNVWNAASINPDGTALQAWSGSFLQEGDGNAGHVYGGTFSPAGDFFANFFPMFNMTEAAGFGGIRRYQRGPVAYTPVTGVTTLSKNYANITPQPSYGIYSSTYAGEPAFLSDGGLLISWAPDVNQDYGLYRLSTDGTSRMLVYDNPGTSEVRARPLRRRPLPPLVPDAVTQVASLLPPPADGPYDRDGTFTFSALNVYANAPVDTDIVSAPAVGSANTIRFFIDHQRTSPGSFPTLDWPILLGELPVNPDGSIQPALAPANVPLFEQVRSAAGTVPLTRGPVGNLGAAHVAGMNFGRTGATARCVGCHIGHSMMEVPSDAAAVAWTNLAPGAEVRVSSTRDQNQNGGLTDRRVRKGEIWRYWTSEPGQTANQWVKLTFPVPITVRSVVLYNPRSGDEANSSVQVASSVVKVCADTACAITSGEATTGPLAVSGTSASFSDIPARAILVNITGVSGTFYGAAVASLAEIEVIGRGGQ